LSGKLKLHLKSLLRIYKVLHLGERTFISDRIPHTNKRDSEALTSA
jgi:hypothetical protein